MTYEFIVQLGRVMSRPRGLALIFSAAGCAAAVIWFVPPEGYVLAAVLAIGLGAPLLIIALHSLTLTRWIGLLQQAIDNLALELRSVAEPIAGLDTYTHGADLNIGRIGTLQNSLEARFDRFGAFLGESEKFRTELWEFKKNLGRELDTLSRRSVDQISEMDLSMEYAEVLAPQAENAGHAISSTASAPQLPLVSIIITSYNYEEFIHQAITSCLAQTYPHVEVIVVDDVSSDRSVEVAERALANHRNSKIVRRLINGGHGWSMYEGFKECSGDYVAFLDADDILFPDFVGTHVYTHLALPWQVAFTSSDLIHIGPTGRILTGTSGNISKTFLSSPPESNVKLSAIRITPVIDETLNGFSTKINRCVYLPPGLPGYHWAACSGLFFKRSAIDQIAIEDVVRQVRISGDFYFTLSHYFNGSAIIDSKLGGYRIHGNNLFSSQVHLDGIDTSRSVPNELFSDILKIFARCVTNDQLERFSSLLGRNWLYPEMLVALQKYSILMNKEPSQDARWFSKAIIDNFERFSQEVGQDFAIHLLHNKLGVSLEELHQHKLL